jgi:hypothetical protein
VNKTILHKISSFVLAVLVLLLTSSFTIDKHFCGDFLVDSSVFSELQQCKDKVCCSEAFPVNKQKEELTQNCCKETQQVFEGKEYVDFKKFDSVTSKQQLQAVSTQINSFVISEVHRGLNLQYYYSPPILVEVFRIRYQVFLI